MNRQQRRQQKQLSNSHMPRLTLSQNSQLISIEELQKLETISTEDLQNIPQEMKDLLQMEQIQKTKRSYKKRTPDQTKDTSGLDVSETELPPKRPKQTAKQKRVSDGITGLIATIGTGLCTASKVSGKTVLMLDGLAVLNSSQSIADNLIEVGKQYPKVLSALEKMVEGSAIVGLIGAIGGLGTAIAINHGFIKPDVLRGIFNLPETELETGPTLDN